MRIASGKRFAENGNVLIQSYNSTILSMRNKKQYLLQPAEKHSRTFPDRRKFTFDAPSSSYATILVHCYPEKQAHYQGRIYEVGGLMPMQ
jgi:hypothetical protein